MPDLQILQYLRKTKTIIMKSKYLCYVLILVTSMMSCVTGNDDPVEDDGDVVKVGQPLPAFSVQTNGGSIISNESLNGKPSVIVLFHTACGDCQRELPFVQHVYNEYAEKAYFICISRVEEDAAVALYWKRQGLRIPYSAQNDKTIYNLFALHTIPRVYISDENGIIRYQFVEKMGENALRGALDELCKQ